MIRIRVIRKPPDEGDDGIDLRHFEPGFLYEVGNTLGALMLAEGWAEPSGDDEPAMLIPLSEFDADGPAERPPNLFREIYPPYYQSPTELAADRRRRPRPRRRPL